MSSNIRIGVSSCLLGENVRYNGGHKHDRYITDTLGRYFSFVPVCPEVECGLSTPREAMHLEGDPAAPRLVTNRTRIDLTKQMLTYCRVKLAGLEGEELCGFIFKKGSPSCGLWRVMVYIKGVPARTGSGLFAHAVASRFPSLPLAEEGELADPKLREKFSERIFTYRRWKDSQRNDSSLGRLIADE